MSTIVEGKLGCKFTLRDGRHFVAGPKLLTSCGSHVACKDLLCLILLPMPDLQLDTWDVDKIWTRRPEIFAFNSIA